MERPKVRLVYRGEIYDTVEFDRVPMKDEIIWIDDKEFFEVKEVYWGLNGGASLLVSKPYNQNTVEDDEDV